MPLPGGSCSSVGDDVVRDPLGRRTESGSGFGGYSGHLGQAGFPPVLVWNHIAGAKGGHCSDMCQ